MSLRESTDEVAYWPINETVFVCVDATDTAAPVAIVGTAINRLTNRETARLRWALDEASRWAADHQPPAEGQLTIEETA